MEQIKKIAVLMAVTVSVLGTKAQEPVQSVLGAEYAFAAYALAHNANEAFFRFMDDNAVVFSKGQAVSARKQWQAYPVFQEKWIWQPAFAGISMSGNLAFTTGPARMQKSVTDTAAVYTGNFTTVWRRLPDGSWKFLVDIGTDAPWYSVSSLPTWKALTVPGKSVGYTANPTRETAIGIDRAFIVDYELNGTEAFRKAFSAQGWLNASGMRPQAGPDAAADALKSFKKITFTPVSGNISSTGDLAYVYGNTMYDGKQDNYLRIWGWENDKWKLIVQVLQLNPAAQTGRIESNQKSTVQLASYKADPYDGTVLLEQLYNAHAGKWHRTEHFKQTTRMYRNDSLFRTEQWVETMLFPDWLRIDRGPKDSGNVLLFRGDSTYSFRSGKLVRAAAQANDLIFLLGGMYFVPLDQVKAKLEKLGYDYRKTYNDTWKGQEVFVLGTDKADPNATQLWIDRARLIPVRMIEMNNGRKLEVSFDGYKAWPRSYSETLVKIYSNGKLIQEEEYSDITINQPVQEAIFDPSRFTPAN